MNYRNAISMTRLATMTLAALVAGASAHAQAQSAKSFENERAALREYYRLLFKKIKKADKDLTARCDVMERAYLARLAQSRIEPTIPLSPPPTPAPLSE